jgi:tRNA (mo5U34)-methyltransferase
MDLERRVASFPRWHYQIDLGGVVTPIWHTSRINRHIQRKAYFFDPLVDLMGGSLEGNRVLDLGCNAGFWSLCAAEAGCDYVLGIDGRQMHVDQANLVLEAKGIDRSRYDFVLGNIFDLDFSDYGLFDVVLCLGLLYHVSKHVNLFEIISRANDDVLVIDTAVSLAPGSYLKLRTETLDSPRDAVDYELVMTPTKQAVLDMASMFGYKGVVLRPRFTDYTGSREYLSGRRRALICTKKTPLDDAPFDTESAGSSLLKSLGLALRSTSSRARDKIGRRLRPPPS